MVPPAPDRSPDVLVLGGGGILGEAWMNALLAGLEESSTFDSRACRCYLGTSAGSIVAASLVAGLAPRERLGALPEQPPVPEAAVAQGNAALAQVLEAAARLGGSMAAPLVSLALSSTAAGGALLRRAALARVPPGRRSLDGLARVIEREGLSWDGRLRVAAVELETGRRVIFGSPTAPQVSVSAAVQASCAIPGVFRPVRAGGRTYVDGGAWSPTNMDAVEVARGTRVVCLNPTASMPLASGALAGALGRISRGVAAAEALTLRRRGALVTTINPDSVASALMGSNLMDPSRRDEVIAAGLAQGRRLAAQRAHAAA